MAAEATEAGTTAEAFALMRCVAWLCIPPLPPPPADEEEEVVEDEMEAPIMLEATRKESRLNQAT